MAMTVKRGDVVRWEGGEGTVHQVIADDAHIDIGDEHFEVEGGFADPALIIHNERRGYTLKYWSEVERVESSSGLKA